jgi:hypothetical protein
MAKVEESTSAREKTLEQKETCSNENLQCCRQKKKLSPLGGSTFFRNSGTYIPERKVS